MSDPLEDKTNPGGAGPAPGGDSGPLPPLLGEPERTDVEEIHKAIVERERAEPAEGMEPAPLWVWGASVVVLFAMGFYLGRYWGGFSAEPHLLYQKAAVSAAEEPPPQGDVIYSGICQPCHQAGGVGLEGKYPPLAGSEWVNGDPATPVRIVLHGLTGPVTVKGATFVNEMPPQGPQLSDAEVAAVLTYVRSSFGNKAGRVDADLVKKIRAEAPGQGLWTAEKLKAAAAAPPAEKGAAKP